MSREGFYQLVCVILLVVFIGFSLSEEKEVTKSATEIAEEIAAVIDTENLVFFDEGRFEEEFGLDADTIESWAFIGSEDVMDVREILVIKLREGTDGEEIISAVEKRAEEKYNVYKDYDPVASAVLQARVTETNNGVIFYSAHENAREGAEIFIKSTQG